MAHAKLQQISLTSGNDSTQPPFPGGWVLAVFDALSAFSPALEAKYRLPISQRTKERIKASEAVKQRSYDKIETSLVQLVTALFPRVSVVNGFAKKYVNEYFRLWRQAVEFAPAWVKCLGIEPGEPHALGRALVRDLVLRLCYLESCERKLNKKVFRETELAFLRYDSPPQIYQALISEQVRLQNTSVEKLAGRLKVTEKSLQRVKHGESLPSLKLLLDMTRPEADRRLLAGIGFMDRLLRNLGLQESVPRIEFLAIAAVFFRFHPQALEAFTRRIPRTTESGVVAFEACDFEHVAAFGDGLLLHPGYDALWSEMPDALWRCHLYTLQFARFVDLARAYFQFTTEDSDAPLEAVLRDAERESDGCHYHWMEKLRQNKSDGRFAAKIQRS
jgi:hypothetical protein